MKKFVIKTKKIFFNNFNSIRTKKDVILLLLETIKQLLINDDKNQISEFNDDFRIIKNKDDLNIVLYIDKMKRIFFCSENKIQSFAFPFNLIYENDKFKFYYKGNNLELQYITTLISVFNESPMNSIFDLAEMLLDNENYIDKDSLNVLNELVLFLSAFEDGYFRMDFCDEENFEKDLHPLHHIDFYYTNTNTFKLGLSSEITMKEIIKIVDIKQKCFNIL